VHDGGETDDALDDRIQLAINDYYNSIMCCVITACKNTLLTKKVTSYYEQYVTPGWNDIVSKKHAAAREAFLEWVFMGKTPARPRIYSHAEDTCGF